MIFCMLYDKLNKRAIPIGIYLLLSSLESDIPRPLQVTEQDASNSDLTQSIHMIAIAI